MAIKCEAEVAELRQRRVLGTDHRGVMTRAPSAVFRIESSSETSFIGTAQVGRPVKAVVRNIVYFVTLLIPSFHVYRIGTMDRYDRT